MDLVVEQLSVALGLADLDVADGSRNEFLHLVVNAVADHFINAGTQAHGLTAWG